MKTALMLAVLLTPHVPPELAVHALTGHALRVRLAHAAARLVAQEQQLPQLELIMV